MLSPEEKLLQPNYLQQLRDPQPSKLPQKIIFIASEERHDATVLYTSSNSISQIRSSVSGNMGEFDMCYSFTSSIAHSEITWVTLIG